MLIKRIITGIIGIILTVYIVHFGNWLFGGAVLILALTAWHEFCKAFRHMDTKLWYGVGLLAIAFLVGCAWIGSMEDAVAVILLTTLMVLGKAVLTHRKFTIQEACVTVTGIFYIGLSFAHLILLRWMDSGANVQGTFGEMSLGSSLVWVAFIGTWANDTFAFFVGSAFGKHKLCPEISPGKTREGFIGGIAGTVLCSVGLGVMFQFSLPYLAVLGVLIAVAATIGDLVESSFKRLTGIKDSGQILPGHGGVLDRFDSILFTVPLVYYYVQIFKIYE